MLSSGCAVFQPVKDMNDYVVRSLRPNPRDYRDSTEDEYDEWAFVGKEGRGHQSGGDKRNWFDKNLTSAKARSIEDNLGVYQ
jgi:hypothetical protein